MNYIERSDQRSESQNWILEEAKNRINRAFHQLAPPSDLPMLAHHVGQILRAAAGLEDEPSIVINPKALELATDDELDGAYQQIWNERNHPLLRVSFEKDDEVRAWIEKEIGRDLVTGEPI